MTNYDIKVAIKAENETQAKARAKVVKSFVASLKEEEFNLLTEKIKANPKFFESITPYLKMI